MTPAHTEARVEEQLLDALTLPSDIKSLDEDQLAQLASQVRGLIIEVGSNNGGHLASPLGAVDLAVALLHVFDVERDKVVWDVGHQSNAFKILTGRRGEYHTIRKRLGLSGYPKRSESRYDSFGTGHSSTSISAALGMAVARDARKENHEVIAVIGDGAIGAGMALEGLSNAGHLKSRLVVVLNDNEMSISRSVGGISSYLRRLIATGVYNRARDDFKSFVAGVSKLTAVSAQRVERSVGGMAQPGSFFEAMGFRYFGPVDGNDVATLVHCLQYVKSVDGPVLLHCVTRKGKGYPHAEADPLKWHGVNQYEISAGEFLKPRPKGRAKEQTFTEAFSVSLTELAEEDDRIVGITAAMSTGTGLNLFQERFPHRFFDVGICEQHAVTFAAGLAAEGMRPVAAIYSTFLQRGFDQFVHDVCLQNLPVTFAIDRAGLVGEDSPTQQGVFDVSYLRCIPNIRIITPRDAVDLRLALKWALAQESPVALRYARSAAPTIGSSQNRDASRGEILRNGADAYFLAIGPCVGACIDAAVSLENEGFSIGVADARFVKPLDTDLLDEISHLPIVTVEENTIEGGFGSAVLEHFEGLGLLEDLRIKRCGVADRFLDHATRAEQLEECGLDGTSLAGVVRDFLARTNRPPSRQEPLVVVNQ